MNHRTASSFPAENGWATGSGPSFNFPPYQNVLSEVPNFSNSSAPPQIAFPSSNFTSDSLKRNSEHGKFPAGLCAPYASDVNSFECVNNLKQPNPFSSYSHVSPFPQSMQGSNHANFTPCIGNNSRNVAHQATYFNTGGSSLPTEQSTNFHSLPPSREAVQFQNVPAFPPHPPIGGLQPAPFVQRQVFDIPPPPVIRGPPSSVENISIPSFPLPPLLAPDHHHQFPNFPGVPPPVYPHLSPGQPVAEGCGSEKERLLDAFIGRRQTIVRKEATRSSLTVPEFRCALKRVLSLKNALLSCKQNLSCLLHGDEDKWNAELKRLGHLKEQISSVWSVLSDPDNLSAVKKRIIIATKKKALKCRLKQEASFSRLRKVCEREALHQEIDKWLDGIKEKNLKLKREAEMKKEADNILSEVRRKIQEVKRAREKLNLFEKLRATRQANAEQKGLFLSSAHGVRFCERLSVLRGMLSSQLLDYEGEEHALRVMLEAEQVNQLEEEALWRMHKTKALQKKKQQGVKEALFGHTEEPSPGDDLFLFHQHQNAGNCSIDALVQIRHHWDVHLTENGETIPQQWIVPFPPSSTTWEVSLELV